MAQVVVLAQDWDNRNDPIQYYSDDPGGCLDLSSFNQKPLAVLRLDNRTTMDDCEHGRTYNVCVCTVTP